MLEIDSNGVVKGKLNLEALSKQAKKTEKDMSGIDEVFRSLNPSSLFAVAGITALVTSLKGMISSVKESIKVFSEFETMQKGLETFYQSAERGKAVFEDLRRLSNETTFGVDELANASTQLLNVGVATSDLEKRLIQLGNIAQGDKGKFAELTSVFAKINSTGKATSIQLQQLAMRGVPIYDQLKKIGVTGVASLSDIEQVMENLTEEGGQFYNAMNNINDTIEGKEGFIRDYMRELKANFIETTGLAELYKSLLDLILPIIGSIADALRQINENPLLKALLQGALVTLVTTLVGSIVGGLIPALVTVASLVSAINPTALIGLLAGVGVGGAIGIGGGLAVGISSLKKSNDELNDTVKQSQKQLEELNSIMKTDGYRGIIAYNRQSDVDFMVDMMKKREQLLSTGRDKKGNLTPEARAGIDEADMMITAIQRKIDKWDKILEDVDFNAKREKIANKYLTEINENDNSSLIRELEKDLADMQDYIKTGMKATKYKDSEGNWQVDYVKLDENDKSEIVKVIEHIEMKLDELKGNNQLPEMEGGVGLNFSEQFGELAEFFGEGGGFQQELLSSISGTDVGGVIESMMSGMDPLTAVLKEVAKVFLELLTNIDSVKEALNIIHVLLEPIIKVLEPLINSVLKPVIELVKTVGETIAQILAPIMNFLVPIINILLIQLKLASAVLKIIGGAFEWLNDNVIVPLGNTIIDALNTVIYAINSFLSLFSSRRLEPFERLQTVAEMLAEEEEDELSRLQKLNDAFDKLKDAILKQEEYYLKTKTGLNASTYNEQKVNDMILTPQGQFSTHPDDYIIATKNPSSLGSFNVQINNSVSNEVTATATRGTDANGMERLIVQISKKISNDVAEGSNGWDNALLSREMRLYGRSAYR